MTENKFIYYRFGDFNIIADRRILAVSPMFEERFALFETSPYEKADFTLAFCPESPVGQISSAELLYDNDQTMYPTKFYRKEDQSLLVSFHCSATENDLFLEINPSWNTLTMYGGDEVEPDMIFTRIGSLLNLLFLKYDTCVFHGVVMEYGGKGILVMASSGTGKTTHTNLWEEKEQARILNGDRCLCRRIDGAWYAYGMPWIGSSMKVINDRVPVTDLVILARDSYNHVEQLTGFKAEINLLQRIFSSSVLEDLQELAFDYVHDLAVKTTVHNLFCLPNYEAVDVLKEAVFRED